MGLSKPCWLYLLAGLALRLALLAWGTYQDQVSDVPYTDIDYSVFSDAARVLLHGCPIDAVLAAPAETLEQLAEPEGLHCAQGWVPVLSRFVLHNDPTLTGGGSNSGKSAFVESGSIEYAWTRVSLAIVRPIFRTFGSIGDPYARPTYRYTPLLAAVLAPGQMVWLRIPSFGKWLFVLADLLCAILMWDLLDGRRQPGTEEGAYAHWPAILWLLNPFVAQLSTRGSAESLVGVFVLLFLALFLRSSPEAPIVPLDPPAVASAVSTEDGSAKDADTRDQQAVVAPTSPQASSSLLPLPEAAEPISSWGLEALLAPIVLAIAVHLKLYPIIYSAPIIAHLRSTSRLSQAGRAVRGPSSAGWIQFALVAGATLISLNGGCYLIWGQPFVEHTYLYHLHRQDHRHNFSAYFLPTYLSSAFSTNSPAPWTKTYPLLAEVAAHPLATRVLDTVQRSSAVLSFAPQLALCASLGFSLGKHDLVMAMSAQTLAFVAWNKVCTSQYFLWALWLLPLVVPSLRFKSRVHALALPIVWVAAQALWLALAYQLEFRARDTFVRLWAAAGVLLVTHAWILISCVQAWATGRSEALSAASNIAVEKKNQ